jgi:serine kinase of HPr protein (carbohydrate metabolism regulator)
LNSADTDNFTIANLRTGRALGWVTETTAASQLYFRHHFLEGAVLSMIAALRAVAVHGACLLVDRTGILLCGDSGAGKSTLAYAGARSGWTYVSDDATNVLLDRDDSFVVGNCHKVRFRPSAVALFPEIDGRPITPRAAGKPSIEVQTSEWPEITTSHSAEVGLIIFLNRGEPRQEVARLSPSDVIPWFVQHILPSPSSRAAQQDAVARLLTAPIYELRYQDLRWAIQRVNQLVRDGQ